jgi:hypothetical protein
VSRNETTLTAYGEASIRPARPHASTSTLLHPSLCCRVGVYFAGCTHHLIAWDIRAPPNYLTTKRAIFFGVVLGWEELFVDGAIDWRHLSWGGVKIDARPSDATDETCNCIPAADDPDVARADDAE